MAPAAHTSQTPANGNAANGAAITLGVRFTVSESLDIAAVSFYAPTTNTGTYTGGLWQTTADDDPNGSGAGTLLQSGSLASGSVTPGAWNDIPLASPVTCTTGVVYTAGVHASSGQFVLTTSVFSSTAITGNGVTLLQSGTDPNPPGLGSMLNGSFTEGAALAYTATATGSDYFIDVALDDGGPIIVALGTATETDSAIAVSRLKIRTLGLASETDTAVAVSRRKTRTLGLATSTEVALPIGRVKVRTLGVATETNSAFAVSRTKLRTLGLASETDAALPITLPGVADVKGASTPAVTAAYTSSTAVTAGRPSTTAVTARRTSNATVG